MASFLSCRSRNYNDIEYYDDRNLWYEAVDEEVKSLENYKNWEVWEVFPIYQMDVKGAFLHAEIEETVYLKPPTGVNVNKHLS